jgi:hypothetical protein
MFWFAPRWPVRPPGIAPNAPRRNAVIALLYLFVLLLLGGAIAMAL